MFLSECIRNYAVRLLMPSLTKRNKTKMQRKIALGHLAASLQILIRSNFIFPLIMHCEIYSIRHRMQSKCRRTVSCSCNMTHHCSVIIHDPAWTFLAETSTFSSSFSSPIYYNRNLRSKIVLCIIFMSRFMTATSVSAVMQYNILRSRINTSVAYGKHSVLTCNSCCTRWSRE